MSRDYAETIDQGCEVVSIFLHASLSRRPFALTVTAAIIADHMETLGKLSSERERRAEEAARHVEARYKCAYMKGRIGEVADGVITGITHFGLFITLRELSVDGLAHVTSLRNDYYHMEHGGLRLTGERTGETFALGDTVKVRIMRVDVDDARIDLAIVQDERPHAPGPAAGRRRRGRGAR